MMTCAEFEAVLADLMDGTLAADQAAEAKAHESACGACAELARDVAGATAFIERAETVQPPCELVNKILFEATSGPSRVVTRPSFLARWFGPEVQPRFAMGMAMTVISFVMLGRFTGVQLHQLNPADLSPSKVWTATESRVQRTWDRAVKQYENLRLVYDVRNQLQQWNEDASASGAKKQQ